MRLYMKNAIEYFYNLRPNEIRKNKTEYLFEIDNQYYSIKECNRSLEDLKTAVSECKFLCNKRNNGRIIEFRLFF